jgi:prevent-host-death family protein
MTDEAFGQIADGQPLLLPHHGRPTAVVVDLDSWEEEELATTEAP